MNTGVLLIRNTDWSRNYMADVGQYAYMPTAQLHEQMLPVRSTPPPHFPPGTLPSARVDCY